MKTLITALLVAGLLAGCSNNDDRIAFDGQFYKTRLNKINDTRHQFQATAKPVSASLEGAREAALYQATTYCVTEYGSSKIDWVVGPETPNTQLVIVDDTLTFEGACPQ